MSPFIKKLTLGLLMLVYVLTHYQVEGENRDFEATLIKELIENYSSIYVRPNRDPVIVSFRFSPTILTLDEPSQELQLRGMLALIWEDNRLTWDPEKYGGLNETHIPLVEDNKPIIWKPELVLNESIDKDSKDFHVETNVAKLLHNGTIQWYTLAMTTSYCRVDVQRFPFDKQSCELTFTTWLYHSSEQIFCLIDDIIHNESYQKYKKPTGVWDFNVSNPLVGNASYDCSTCLGREQSYVQYNLLLTRTNHLWYVMNYMFPCVVLMVMTIIIPCLSHKKGVDASSFGLTCVLTLFVFLTFLFTQLPATGPPWMGFYIASLIVQAVFATVYVTAKVPKVDTDDQADTPLTNEATDDSGRNDSQETNNPIYRIMSWCRRLATRTIVSIKQKCKKYWEKYRKKPCKILCKVIEILLIIFNISCCIVFCAFLISWSSNESK